MQKAALFVLERVEVDRPVRLLGVRVDLQPIEPQVTVDEGRSRPPQ